MDKIYFIGLLFLSVTFSSCEKDDICDAATATTPRLTIDFYDVNNPSVLKNVTNLKVVGEGMSQGLTLTPTATGDAKYVTSGNGIEIPLKTNENKTTYTFVFNFGAADSNTTFTDKIEINYTRTEVFVSRACGYKTLFTLNPTNSVLHTSVPTTTDKWIKYISVEKTNIENENETHLKLFF